MQRILICLLVTIAFISCDTTERNPGGTAREQAAEQPRDTAYSSTPIQNQIVPGDKLGKIAIGALPQDVISELGKPDAADAAMGKAWMTWSIGNDTTDHETELNVYVTYRDSTMMQKVVKQIRTTSASFIASGNIHVHSSLDDIKKKFPGIQEAARYSTQKGTFAIYDAASEGIAFDVGSVNGQEICTAISVHIKGVPVTDTYIYLHPDTKKIK